jgi:hypothetical protein
MKFRIAVAALAAAALALAGAPKANAQLLSGSLPLAGIVVGQNSGSLGTSTQITSAFAITSGFGTTDYAPIPLGTAYATTTLDLTNFTTFSLSDATYGTFTTTSGVIVQQTANFLDVFILGTYTPGPGLPGFIATPASLRISVNQSGASLSEAITLVSPPLTLVPEPSTYAMLATSGIGGLMMLRRRKKA